MPIGLDGFTLTPDCSNHFTKYIYINSLCRVLQIYTILFFNYNLIKLIIKKSLDLLVTNFWFSFMWAYFYILFIPKDGG